MGYDKGRFYFRICCGIIVIVVISHVNQAMGNGSRENHSQG